MSSSTIRHKELEYENCYFFSITCNTGRDWRVPFQFCLALRLFSEIFDVSKGSPFQFLWYFARMDVEKSKRVSPFPVFFALWVFKSLQRAPRRPPIFLIFCNGMDVEKSEWVSAFRFFSYCKRILDTLKSFRCFWVLDLALTYVVPGLFALDVSFDVANFFR